jgi:hypothetical protein
MRVRHVDAQIAERVAVAESCRTVKFGVRSDCQSTGAASTSLPARRARACFMRAT